MDLDHLKQLVDACIEEGAQGLETLAADDELGAYLLTVAPAANLRTPAGTRCPRCQYVAPNLYGCVRCNPEPLGERLTSALETIEKHREEIRALEATMREVRRV